MAYSHIGKNFTPPDVRAKITGKAKYAEDFRAEGMLFCRLLLSPVPHARIRSLDTTDALKTPGVVAILTADDVPASPEIRSPILTNEPHFVGQPVLAVAAENETVAQDAIEKIKIDFEPLPYTLDPLESLFPGGPDAREKSNTVDGSFGAPPVAKSVKWTARQFADAGEDQLPMGEPIKAWSYGDLDDGFEKADLILDETFVLNSNSHHCMETRSSMAYWQNGKCYVHGSTQSSSMVNPGLAKSLGIDVKDLIYISEFCGGGFGSKIASYPMMLIAPLMAKKVGRPVMMRISRAEEFYIGSARPGFQGRVKLGFNKKGRVTAADLYIVQENGPNGGGGDYTSAAGAVSLLYQPQAMRFQGIAVSTNTTPKGAQRGPGQNQIAQVMEPLMDKAARSLGMDRVEIRRVNAADNNAKYNARQGPVTSAYQKEALDKGSVKFNWQEKKKLSGRKKGSKVTGIGIGQSFHSAGANGYDGLVRLTEDGKLHIHTGVGNLGTFSHSATSRVAAEVLKCNWDNCVIERGDSRRGLPWNRGQGGSNTSFTMSRTNYVAAMDAVNKLKEIAAQDLGGNADDYDIGGEKVFSKKDPSISLTYADAAKRAIEIGGKYSGHEVPDDIHPTTKLAVAGIKGSGLIGVAKDNLEKNGMVPAITAGFMTIELDIETGKYEILDYVGIADCGTVVHPMGLETQIKGGAVMGFGMATLERTVYDPQNGLPANVGLYQSKPPSYLDIPSKMQWDAVDIADPQNPVGVKGIGEPVMGCAAGALISAISDALGGHLFNRTPVTTDMIVNLVSGNITDYGPLRINSQ